jgi:SAM-dependent methyltransferase
MEEMRSRFQALARRHEEGTAPRAVSSFQLFQTPAEIAGQLVEIMDAPRGARWLEPSAGLGRLLDAIQVTEPAEVVAVEIAAPCCAELYRQDRAGVHLRQGDFLALRDLGTFDAIAMNPPFHMRADIRHIEHALALLRPGGVLGAICMDTPHRIAAFRNRAETWVNLPARSFRESNTGVDTCLLVIRKESETNEH